MRLKCQLLTSQVHRGGNVGRNRRQRRDNKIDVGIQTENDIVTALTASGVDADEVFIELSRPLDQKTSGAFSGMQMNETTTESNSADEKIFPTYETDVHAFVEPKKTVTN